MADLVSSVVGRRVVPALRAWFVSGAVLLFVPFPALSQGERLAHGEPVDIAKLIREPSEALAAAPGAERLLLISVAGHPTYWHFLLRAGQSPCRVTVRPCHRRFRPTRQSGR